MKPCGKKEILPEHFSVFLILKKKAFENILGKKLLVTLQDQFSILLSAEFCLR